MPLFAAAFFWLSLIGIASAIWLNTVHGYRVTYVDLLYICFVIVSAITTHKICEPANVVKNFAGVFTFGLKDLEYSIRK